jgi:hypothetical protein
MEWCMEQQPYLSGCNILNLPEKSSDPEFWSSFSLIWIHCIECETSEYFYVSVDNIHNRHFSSLWEENSDLWIEY